MENNESMCQRFMEETYSRCVMCYIFSTRDFCRGQAHRAAWFLWTPSEDQRHAGLSPLQRRGVKTEGAEDAAGWPAGFHASHSLTHLALQALDHGVLHSPLWKHHCTAIEDPSTF